ncbi:MAG: ZIP family metal transporter [Nevskia sp.]|nr:ZIP family metal transporter [Nevskia sp.]
MILGIACAAFCATFAGGLFALRLGDKLHLVLGFSAGAVIAVAFFDLLPEAIELGAGHERAATLLEWSALGFLLYLVLDRVQLIHADRVRHDHHGGDARSVPRGALGAGSLSAHSFLDGVAIGLGFEAATAVGAVVTVAVLTHDFSDGINTMNVVLKNGGDRRQGLRWLLADAIAPGAGVASTLLFSVPERVLGIALAVFAGFFLYIGASDLIPESHHAHPRFLTTAMTVLGAGVLYLVVAVASR